MSILFGGRQIKNTGKQQQKASRGVPYVCLNNSVTRWSAKWHGFFCLPCMSLGHYFILDRCRGVIVGNINQLQFITFHTNVGYLDFPFNMAFSVLGDGSFGFLVSIC
jgi:hypothetical protein